MPKRDAFVLTPIGPKEGRFAVEPARPARPASQAAKVVKEASPRSRGVIQSILTDHAVGLRKLADR